MVWMGGCPALQQYMSCGKYKMESNGSCRSGTRRKLLKLLWEIGGRKKWNHRHQFFILQHAWMSKYYMYIIKRLICSRLIQILPKSKTVKIKYLYSLTVICCHSIYIETTGTSSTDNSIGTKMDWINNGFDFYKKSSNGWPVYKMWQTSGATTQYFYLSNNGYWSVS